MATKLTNDHLLNDDHFFGVSRVVVVLRFDCTEISVVTNLVITNSPVVMNKVFSPKSIYNT